MGDSVYVKIQPYVQTSLANRSSNKLRFQFFVPFTIVAKIGDVAYQLQLPEDCLIHLVFYVSQLVTVDVVASQASPKQLGGATSADLVVTPSSGAVHLGR